VALIDGNREGGGRIFYFSMKIPKMCLPKSWVSKPVIDTIIVIIQT